MKFSKKIVTGFTLTALGLSLIGAGGKYGTTLADDAAAGSAKAMNKAASAKEGDIKSGVFEKYGITLGSFGFYSDGKVDNRAKVVERFLEAEASNDQGKLKKAAKEIAETYGTSSAISSKSEKEIMEYAKMIAKGYQLEKDFMTAFNKFQSAEVAAKNVDADINEKNYQQKLIDAKESLKSTVRAYVSDLTDSTHKTEMQNWFNNLESSNANNIMPALPSKPQELTDTSSKEESKLNKKQEGETSNTAKEQDKAAAAEESKNAMNSVSGSANSVNNNEKPTQSGASNTEFARGKSDAARQQVQPNTNNAPAQGQAGNEGPAQTQPSTNNSSPIQPSVSNEKSKQEKATPGITTGKQPENTESKQEKPEVSNNPVSQLPKTPNQKPEGKVPEKEPAQNNQDTKKEEQSEPLALDVKDNKVNDNGVGSTENQKEETGEKQENPKVSNTGVSQEQFSTTNTISKQPSASSVKSTQEEIDIDETMKASISWSRYSNIAGTDEGASSEDNR